jgi:hypothetical protein
MVALFEIDDFEAWKKRFDSDPVGREEAATGHRILRSLDNPREVLLTIEFSSEEAARALLARLATAPPPPEGENMTVKLPPTIFAVDDSNP